MLLRTKGIVLHYVKFGEKSVIATIYTEKSGRQSYIVNSALGKKAKNKASLLQPLYLLDMVVYQKESREVQRLKEFSIATTFQNLPFDIKKTSQAFFIAEILYKTLKEEEGYPQLFSFIENAIHYFDLMDDGAINFHLYFLARLTEYLGILPNIEDHYNISGPVRKNGSSSSFDSMNSLNMDKEQTRLFNQLINLKIEMLSELNLNNTQRKALLIKIIEYYHLHFDSLGDIKSLPVLKEVFS